MINKYGILKKIGNAIKSVAKNSFVNKLIQPAAALGSMVPVAGPFIEKAIENAPKTAYEYGNILTGMAEGKKLNNLLHNYYENTELIGNPLNILTLPNEGIQLLRQTLSKA